MLPYAEQLDFNLLLPEFRGPNVISNPDAKNACGSIAARADVKDAIDYVVENEGVDRENIFLLGLSGGGHMALMMAGYCPEYFKAIGAFVPICNLEKWAEENQNYRPHILACCGDGEQMLRRSPVSYIDKIATANLKIFHGKYDSCVPVTQSMELYAEVFKINPRARVFLDIFDGGHEIDMKMAMYWLLSQYKGDEKTAITG
jgi:dipeptidyl aminopeptidase/acylaminoacyl peptidase